MSWVSFQIYLFKFSFNNRYFSSEKHPKFFSVLVYFPIRMDPRVIMKEQIPGVSSHSENIGHLRITLYLLWLMNFIHTQTLIVQGVLSTLLTSKKPGEKMNAFLFFSTKLVRAGSAVLHCHLDTSQTQNENSECYPTPPSLSKCAS